MKLYACLPDEELLALAHSCAERLETSLEEVEENQLSTLKGPAVIIMTDQEPLPKIPEVSFGLLSNRFWDIDHLQTLVNTPRVEGVIPDPTNEDLLLALMRKLLGIDKPDTQGSMRAQLSIELVEMYDSELYPKLKGLIEVADTSLKTRDKMDLEELKKRVHTFSGNAGTFGFAKATDICRKLEYELDQEIKEGHGTLTKNLKVRILEIICAFQHIYLNGNQYERKSEGETLYEIASKSSKERSHTPCVYLVTNDLVTVQIFQRLGYEFLVETRVEVDPTIACEELKSKEFDPTCVVIHDYYPLYQFKGTGLINTYKKTTRHSTHKIGLITTQKDLAERINALDEGVDYILEHPISEEHVRRLLGNLMVNSSSDVQKVLVVDDDEATCEAIVQGLHDLEVDIRATQDESKLFEYLDSYKPDLLLLDLSLNTYHGLELLQVLHSDMRYSTLEVVVVTASKNKEVLNKAAEYGYDNIIFKPIDIRTLQLTTRNILDRKKNTELTRFRDPVTGLYQPLTFMNMLKAAVQAPRSHEEAAILLLIALKDFEEFEQDLSQGKLDDLLISVSNVLRQTFSISHFLGNKHDGAFGCYFENVDPNHITQLFNEFIYNINRELTHFEYHDLKFSGGGAIASLPNSDTEAFFDQVLHNKREADMMEGSNLVLTEVEVERHSKSLKPLCVIVDDDKGLTEVLKFAFARNGFDVEMFYSGKDALSFFAKMENAPHNLLILLDRMLPDMDGLDILKNLNTKFTERIKVFILTSLTGEDDILSGLKEGAIDCVAKPLSVDVLIQKAKNVLEL